MPRYVGDERAGTWMLEELRITSLGVIDSSTLELGPGLTVITGETGAGKTMVVTALGLLLGARSDAGVVRKGARHARVEGVVATPGLTGLVQAVEAIGGQEDQGVVVLARNIAAEGRSRAWVGGAGVPVSALAGVTESLVAVHGQSDQHRLLRQEAQREALDRFGGEALSALASRFGHLHQELVSVEAELTLVLTSARERAREADQLRFDLGEIEAVEPLVGEDVALADEEGRLGFADTLRLAAEQAREFLNSDERDLDALSALADAKNALTAVREHDPQAADLADRLSELTYLVSDVAADVASYASGLEMDPARLATVSARRAALTSLTRKYGDSIEEVLAWAGVSAKRLVELDGADDRIELLQSQRKDLRERLALVAAELTRERRDAALRLGERVTSELASLAMPHARVVISVNARPIEAAVRPGPGELETDSGWVKMSYHGVDEIQFELAANSGAEFRPLHKGASGGELSRVMLAVEVALAQTSPVPIFVFDEVDAGVGGKAAIEIGRRLARLATSAQVLVVTHLPQVAAYGDRHVVVSKASDGSVTTSGLVTLDEVGRERELSRMLAGLEDSDSALAHARELLQTAAPERACLHAEGVSG